MTIFDSSHVTFTNTANKPLCYALQQGQNPTGAASVKPSEFSADLVDGGIAIVAHYVTGRGTCENPITANFHLPLATDDQGDRIFDANGATATVLRREEDGAFHAVVQRKRDELDVVTHARLSPEMVRGLLVQLDDHVEKEVGAQHGVGADVLHVDAEHLRDQIFSLAVGASDLVRSGSSPQITNTPVARIVSEVAVATPSARQLSTL